MAVRYEVVYKPGSAKEVRVPHASWDVAAAFGGLLRMHNPGEAVEIVETDADGSRVYDLDGNVIRRE